jgi:hypothetical protein
MTNAEILEQAKTIVRLGYMGEEGKQNDAIEGLRLMCKTDPSAQSPAAMGGYEAKPLEVIGGMAIILNQRRDECKECKWHPDVCEHCEVNKLENERIEKEMAS